MTTTMLSADDQAAVAAQLTQKPGDAGILVSFDIARTAALAAGYKHVVLRGPTLAPLATWRSICADPNRFHGYPAEQWGYFDPISGALVGGDWRLIGQPERAFGRWQLTR